MMTASGISFLEPSDISYKPECVIMAWAEPCVAAVLFVLVASPGIVDETVNVSDTALLLVGV